MTNPGALRERLVIEAPVETDDGAGGCFLAYAPAGSVWTALEPLEARPLAANGGAGAVVRYRATLRAGPEITTRHRLRAGARILRIVSVRPKAEDARFLLVEAEERID